MTPPGTVGRTAFLLGFAGLLPQVAAVAVIALGRGGGHLSFEISAVAQFVGALYAGVILSFLGGMWWGFAMRREQGQGLLATVAVLPSLVAFACMIAAASALPAAHPGPLIALGSAILLTLPIDRHLVTTGEVPSGWMALRIPLSVGLGALTIVAGLVGP